MIGRIVGLGGDLAIRFRLQNNTGLGALTDYDYEQMSQDPYKIFTTIGPGTLYGGQRYHAQGGPQGWGKKARLKNEALRGLGAEHIVGL